LLFCFFLFVVWLICCFVDWFVLLVVFIVLFCLFVFVVCLLFDVC